MVAPAHTKVIFLIAFIADFYPFKNGRMIISHLAEKVNFELLQFLNDCVRVVIERMASVHWVSKPEDRYAKYKGVILYAV